MIKVNVEIDNKSWHKKIKKPQKYFKQKLKKISKINKFFAKKNIVFTILLTNSLYIKKLNKKFRKKNKSTDALSFPYYSFKNLNSIKEDNIYIGDIAICSELIAEEAISQGKETKDHLIHIFGFRNIGWMVNFPQFN